MENISKVRLLELGASKSDIVRNSDLHFRISETVELVIQGAGTINVCLILVERPSKNMRKVMSPYEIMDNTDFIILHSHDKKGPLTETILNRIYFGLTGKQLSE